MESKKKRSRREKKHKKRHRESRSPSRSSDDSSKKHKNSDKKTEPPAAKSDDKTLSIEETNKLRAMLGLKPLQAPASGSTTAPATKSGTAEVFVQTRNITADKETEKIRQKLELVREKRRVADVISAKPLGEEESDDDITTWVQRSRELEMAKQRAKMLEETEEQITAETPAEKPSYSSRDLAGMRVQHSFDRISDERSIVLTIKDKPVLAEDEGDVLENVNIADDEKAEMNMANRKEAETVGGYGVVRYRPYDDDGTEGTGLLNKYDEEIFGRKKKYFVLSGGGHDKDEQLGGDAVDRKPAAMAAHAAAASSSASYANGDSKPRLAPPKMEVDTDPLNELRSRLSMQNRANLCGRPATLATTSLNNSGPTLASEYYTPEEMAAKFKKVRKVRKPIRTLKADDLLEPDNDVGGADTVTPMETNTKPKRETKTFDDNDADLLNRTKKIREITSAVMSSGAPLTRRLPEHVAVDLLASTTLNPNAAATSSAGMGGDTIMLNLTSEFCRGVGDLPTVVVEESEAVKAEPASTTDDDMELDESSASSDDDERVSMKKPSERNYRKNKGSDDEEARRLRKHGSSKKAGSSSQVKTEPKDAENGDSEEDEFVLGAEPKAASSVAEALRLASMKGYLEKAKDASGGGTTVIGGKVSQLQARSFTVEDRFHGDIDAKFSSGRGGGRGGQAGRSSGGPIVDFCEKDTYKPDVKLEYINAAGKAVDQKEAFRQLSHRFHGKTSGKRKVEKRLRKEAQERRVLSQSSADTPLGTLGRLQARQQKEKSAHVVLSSSGTTGSVSIAIPSAAPESPAKVKRKIKPVKKA